MIQELARLEVYGRRGWLLPPPLTGHEAEAVAQFLRHHGDRYNALLATL